MCSRIHTEIKTHGITKPPPPPCILIVIFDDVSNKCKNCLKIDKHPPSNTTTTKIIVSSYIRTPEG